MPLRAQFETHSSKQVTIIYTMVSYDICKEYLEVWEKFLNIEYKVVNIFYNLSYVIYIWKKEKK